jgi:hypothetical protein
MSRRDGSWTVRLEHDGRQLELNTDSLTLDDLDTAEQVSGIPWPLMHPLRSAKVAKALLMLLLMRGGGLGEDEAVKCAGALTADQLVDAFTFVPPERPLPATGDVTPDPQ